MVIVIVPKKENLINTHVCIMQWRSSHKKKKNTHLMIIYSFPLSLFCFFIGSGNKSTISSQTRCVFSNDVGDSSFFFSNQVLFQVLVNLKSVNIIFIFYFFSKDLSHEIMLLFVFFPLSLKCFSLEAKKIVV